MIHLARVAWAEGREVPVEVAEGGEVHIVLAHGAGSDRSHPLTSGLRDALVGVGATVVTFDYPYRAEGRRAPDRMAVLEAAHGAVLEWATSRLGGPTVLAGRSMGGRVASHLAAAGTPCRSLVLYSYPLHPLGRPDRLRVEHLPSIPVPLLVVRGGNDRMSLADPFDRHVRPLPGVTVVDLEGADHALRRRGIPDEETQRLLAETTLAWLSRH